MVCRNKDKAEEARADIVKETGNKVQCDSLFTIKKEWQRKPSVLYHICDIIGSPKRLVSLQEVYVHILDLSETKKVWEFAEGFKRKYKSLNVLVSNMLVFFLCVLATVFAE